MKLSPETRTSSLPGASWQGCVARSIGWDLITPGRVLNQSMPPCRPRCACNRMQANPTLPWLIITIMAFAITSARSEEHTSELQSRVDLVCRLLLEKKKIQHIH